MRRVLGMGVHDNTFIRIEPGVYTLKNNLNNLNNSNKTSRYNYKKPNTTERRGLVTSRVGQGHYRSELMDKWNKKCSVTRVEIAEVLIASHIVPWRESNDDERLDVENGILLTPNLDALFDRYLISFEESGEIIISEKLSYDELEKLGINKEMKLTKVSQGMKPYLRRHKEKFYKK